MGYERVRGLFKVCSICCGFLVKLRHFWEGAENRPISHAKLLGVVEEEEEEDYTHII